MSAITLCLMSRGMEAFNANTGSAASLAASSSTLDFSARRPPFPLPFAFPTFRFPGPPWSPPALALSCSALVRPVLAYSCSRDPPWGLCSCEATCSSFTLAACWFRSSDIRLNAAHGTRVYISWWCHD